jgi:polyferredoxin
MKKEKPGFASYLPLILMNIMVFTSASLFFAFILHNSDPVPVFAAFAVIQTAALTAFALLPGRFRGVPRHASKILIGSTLLLLAGILGRQNFQMEGFLYLMIAGFVGGPIIHFGMKVLGALFTGRSWCSWGCWTAAVLDFLPYKTNTAWAKKPWKLMRYLHLLLSAVVVSVTYFSCRHIMMSTSADPALNWNESVNAVYWIVTGNVLYYMSGIMLAFVMKDNRAFCKYLCPVAVLLKASAVVSVVRIAPKSESCGGCGKCEEVCPASIAVHSYAGEGSRVKSTECFMCLNCVAVCPEGNLKTSFGFDAALGEKLRKR